MRRLVRFEVRTQPRKLSGFRPEVRGKESKELYQSCHSRGLKYE